MSQSQRSRSDRSAYWQNLVDQWSRSDPTQAAFCRERGITYGSFTWWKRQLASAAWRCCGDGGDTQIGVRAGRGWLVMAGAGLSLAPRVELKSSMPFPLRASVARCFQSLATPRITLSTRGFALPPCRQVEALSSRFSIGGCPPAEGTRLSSKRVIARVETSHSTRTSRPPGHTPRTPGFFPLAGKRAGLAQYGRWTNIGTGAFDGGRSTLLARACPRRLGVAGWHHVIRLKSSPPQLHISRKLGQGR